MRSSDSEEDRDEDLGNLMGKKRFHPNTRRLKALFIKFDNFLLKDNFDKIYPKSFRRSIQTHYKRRARMKKLAEGYLEVWWPQESNNAKVSKKKQAKKSGGAVARFFKLFK